MITGTKHSSDLFKEYVEALKKLNIDLESQRYDIKTPSNILGFYIKESLTIHELSALLVFINSLYWKFSKKDYSYEPKISLLDRLFKTADYTKHDPSSDIKIHCVSMASPGLISLQGAGEIIREIRELIKDLSYRNHYEKLAYQTRVDPQHRNSYKKAFGVDIFDHNIFADEGKLEILEEDHFDSLED